MRKALWVIVLLFAAISVPSAHANAIVQVTISLTFNGNNTCGSGTSLCTQTLSASFQWDNTTNTYVAGSNSFTTSGDLGTSFSLPAGVPKYEPSFQGVLWAITTPLPAQYATLGVNLGELRGPFTPPLQPLVTGVYKPDNVTGLFPSGVGTYEAYVSCTGPSSPCISEGFAPQPRDI